MSVQGRQGGAAAPQPQSPRAEAVTVTSGSCPHPHPFPSALFSVSQRRGKAGGHRTALPPCRPQASHPLDPASSEIPSRPFPCAISPGARSLGHPSARNPQLSVPTEPAGLTREWGRGGSGRSTSAGFLPSVAPFKCRNFTPPPSDSMGAIDFPLGASLR